MSVLFIVVGILFILSLFGVVSFKSFFDKTILTLSSLLILFGYFISDFFIGIVSFNVLFLFAYICLFIFVVKNIYFSFFDLIIVFLLGVSYYFLLSTDLSYMIGYYSDMEVMLSLLLVVVYSTKVYKSIFVSLISSLVCVCISACFSYDNFGVVGLDFLFCFEVVFYSSLFSLVLSLLKMFMEKVYVKKSFVVYDFNSCRYGVECYSKCKC